VIQMSRSISRRDAIIAGVAVVALLAIVYMEMPAAPVAPVPTNPGALSAAQTGSGLFENPSGLGANPAPVTPGGPIAELPSQLGG
jgi:hypothetical protein